MKLITACIIFLLLFSTLTLDSLANSSSPYPEPTGGELNEAIEKIVPIRFLPSSPFYFLITIRENFSRFLKPSSKEKAEFDFILMGKRMKESYILLEMGDVKNASKSLRRYAKRANIFGQQIEKARSQNQNFMDVANFATENIKFQETLIFAISKKWEGHEDAYNFSGNFEDSKKEFIAAVNVVDSIKPGTKGRLILTKPDTNKQDGLPAESTPILLPLESTSSVKPRRIIY